MSLITVVPVGSKTRSVALAAAFASDEFLLATGSWDQDSNTLGLYSITFNAGEMDEAASLDQCQFAVQRTRTVDVAADVRCMQFLSADRLVYGLADGAVGCLGDAGGAEVTRHSSAVTGLDLSGEAILSCSEDGHVMISAPTSTASSLDLPRIFQPTQLRWTGSHTFAVGTANSKVLLYDSRTMKSASSLTFAQRMNPAKQLKIRAVDSDPAAAEWLLGTGDDDGMVRLWDLRNPEQPLTQSAHTGRRPISAVKIHRSLPNTIVSGGTDGSMLLQTFNGAELEEAWRMPTSCLPASVNSIDMLGSLTAAGLDSASSLVWRMNP